MSPSSQRVWIEIGRTELLKKSIKSRPLHRGCGLKCDYMNDGQRDDGRPLHRGCGLKLSPQRVIAPRIDVALFTEGVDWNKNRKQSRKYSNRRPLHRGCGLKLYLQRVIAPRIESPSSQRVWIEIFTVPLHYNFYGSPSSQRVWIEILKSVHQIKIYEVALFTEGVDWNIDPFDKDEYNVPVALFTEGVDWNYPTRTWNWI